jgi:hypothetical protein
MREHSQASRYRCLQPPFRATRARPLRLRAPHPMVRRSSCGRCPDPLRGAEPRTRRGGRRGRHRARDMTLRSQGEHPLNAPSRFGHGPKRRAPRGGARRSPEGGAPPGGGSVRVVGASTPVRPRRGEEEGFPLRCRNADATAKASTRPHGSITVVLRSGSVPACNTRQNGRAPRGKRGARRGRGAAEAAGCDTIR